MSQRQTNIAVISVAWSGALALWIRLSRPTIISRRADGHFSIFMSSIALCSQGVTIMKRYCAISLGLLVCTSATAAEGWTPFRTILGLETVPTGIEIRLDGYDGVCGSVNEGGVQKTWAKIETSQPNEKQHVAILLMAFATGKRISVFCPTNAAWPALSNIVVQSE